MKNLIILLTFVMITNLSFGQEKKGVFTNFFGLSKDKVAHNSTRSMERHTKARVKSINRMKKHKGHGFGAAKQNFNRRKHAWI